jgi:hypothetical protein
MVPHLHSVLRVPDLHAVAGAGLRHHAPWPDVSSSAHPCPQTIPHARTRHLSQAAMQAPGSAVQCTTRCARLLGRCRHHTCVFARFPFLRTLDAGCKLEGCRVSASCHGSPGKHTTATTTTAPSHCGLCSAGYDLHAACCSLFVIAYGPLHRAAVPLSLGLAIPEQDQHQTAIIILCTRRRTNQDSDVAPPSALVASYKRQHPESQTQKMMHSTPARPGTQPIPFLPAL